MDGDYVELDGDEWTSIFKEDVKNDGFWNRVTIHSIRNDFGYYYQADAQCTIGDYTGNCNVRDFRLGWHFTAYADSYGITLESDFTQDSTMRRAASGDWRDMEYAYYDDYYIDMGTWGDDDEGETWENSSTEWWETGSPTSATVGTSFTEASENWEDWTYVDLKANGSRTDEYGSEHWFENISFEGIRCASATYRIYATGHADRTWSSRPTEWRSIDPKGVARWHLALRREFFCPKDMTIHDAAEGVEALRNGRHPDAVVGQFR